MMSVQENLSGNGKRYLRRLVRALDRQITADRLRIYPLILIIAGTLGAVTSSVLRIIDPTIQGPFLPDYLAHWTGGGLLFSSGRGDLYDPMTQHRFQEEAVGPTSRLSWFVSPPVVAALYAPLSLLPYNLSGLLWLVLSSALLVWCVVSLIPMLAPRLMQRRRQTVILAVVASPAVYEILGGGQDSVVVLAIWLVGIRLFMAGRPALAGALLGLGCAKPQLVLLIPLVLLATRNYRALGAFGAVFMALLGASAGLVGFEGMREWAAALASPLYLDQVQHGQAWKMVSLPSFVLALVPPAWGGWLTVTITGAALPAGAGILLLRLRTVRNLPVDTRALWVSALATTIAFSPHLAIYDAVLLIPVVLYLIEQRSSPFLRVSAVAAFALMWLAPALHMAAVSVPLIAPIADAPWSAIPVTAIWWESLKGLKPRHSEVLRGQEVSR